MAYSGLPDFIRDLEENNELQRIGIFVDPVLEIAEVTDRITKSGGKALLFENTGTNFPLLINAFGSDKRMAMAVGVSNLDEADKEIERVIRKINPSSGNKSNKLLQLYNLMKLSAILPSKISKKGKCQQKIIHNPDLGILPVLKCWPYDGGRFITLPIVHTIHPETGYTNAGMYRMQIIDNKTTAMHWQLHKTGAKHYDAWKKTGKNMPVAVALGGDPVYTFSATAPLPENLDEYILAGFLRKRQVKLVKCITNDLWVPEDADIILEGYIDTSEELFSEGPFGDHTGFYSLAGLYPKFHIACISHSGNAVYPATIVGIPPQEDSFLTKAAEKIFLTPVKMTLQPEVVDLHMPDAGVAHNLMIVKIKKSYPGQGIKVINSLLGAGQMMFTKYMVVVSGDINIRDYSKLIEYIFINTDIKRDLIFLRGPLDVLDHSSDSFSFGGKLGIDATMKTGEEKIDSRDTSTGPLSYVTKWIDDLKKRKLITGFNTSLLEENVPLLILSVNRREDGNIIDRVARALMSQTPYKQDLLVLLVDYAVDTADLFMVTWQVLGNTDPMRDHRYLSDSILILDGTIKAFRTGGFTRRWPNILCSDIKTIEAVDGKWGLLTIGPFIPSPSLRYRRLVHSGSEDLMV